MPNLNDQVLQKFVKGHFTDKEILAYYAKKAKDAATRTGIAIDTSNSLAIAANAREMIVNIEAIYSFLGKDDTIISDEKKKK